MNLRPTTISTLRRVAQLATLAAVALAVTLAGQSTSASAGVSAYPSTLYLSNTASAQVTSSTSYQLVTTAPSAASTTTQSRIATLATGYQDFQPGYKPPTTVSNTPTPVAAASTTTPNNKGWIVDGSGGVSFATGTWTFYNTLTENWSSPGSVFASVAVGMWKVKISGGSIASNPTLLVDPTCTSSPCASGAAPGAASPGTSFITSSGSTTVSLPVTVSGFTLASDEHLYVQYWRWQTVAMPMTAGAANRLATFTVNDGNARITFPSPTAMPDTPSVSVASRVKTPSLSATYVEPDNNGTLTFQLCSDNLCNTVLDSSTSSTLANGNSASWASTATLTDGTTYYARVRAQDSLGATTPWSSIVSFVYDTSPPSTPTLSSPATSARVKSAQITASYADTDATEHGGTINFQLCGNSSCSSVVDSGSSSSGLANGSSGSWTPTGHADGMYWWRAQDQDLAGNTSGWSAVRSFTLDTTAPSAAFTASPAALVNAIPQLSATFSDPDAGDTGTITFAFASDPGCSSVVTTSSPVAATNGATVTWTPSSLADGTYYGCARAQDAAGNQSAWTATSQFTLDTTAPTPLLGTTASRTNTTPQLSVTFSDPDTSDSGTVSVQLCHTSSCTSVLQSSTSGTISKGTTFNWTPTSLADGTYYWRAQATDAAGNVSSWSAASSFVFDTAAPQTPALTSPSNGARAHETFTVSYLDSDTTDTGGTVDFQLCSDSACAHIVDSSSVSRAASSWTSTATLTNGATYYWQARDTDTAGNHSGWTTPPRSFVFDNTPPATPALGGPADGAYLATAPSLSATFSDPDAGDTGTVSFQVCTDSSCGTVVASGSSTTGSWTPTLAGGTYAWRAQATDAAGNSSGWSGTQSFTFDGTPPTVPTLGGIGDGSRTLRVPTLTATYADPGAPGNVTGSVLFQLCRTSSCSSPVATTTITSVEQSTTVSWLPTAFGDGTYYWRARATDAAGNQSSWSNASSFVLDTTPPSAPSLALRPGAHVPATPVLSATLDDPGDASDRLRLLVQLCADANCASVIATGSSSDVAPGATATWNAPTLTDGVYFWRAVAEDLLGNQSAWTAAQPFVVDTTPPAAPTTSGTAVGTLVRKARLAVTFAGTDATDTGTVEFQVCADAACTNVVDDGVSDSVAAGDSATWTPTDLADGAYFWRARTRDEAGNDSAWSDPVSFTLDATPPSKPRVVTATVTSHTLTLRLRAPSNHDHVVGYVLLVNGHVEQKLKTRVLQIKLQPGKRTFAIAAVDDAGNVSAPTQVYPRIGPALKQARVHSR